MPPRRRMLAPSMCTAGRLVRRCRFVAGLLLFAAPACSHESGERQLVTPSAPPVIAAAPPVQVASIPWTPVFRSKTNPVLPAAAKRAGVTGPVFLEVRVDEMGRVSVLRVLRGHTLLNDLATSAARQWQLEPVIFRGVPTAVVQTLLVTFRDP